MNADHTHAGFPIDSDPGTRLGAPGDINGPALGRLIGAGYDSCKPCQDAALTEIAGDPLTVTRLVELAAIAIQGAAGGIPSGMLTPRPAGRVSKPFADLMALGADADDDHRGMYSLATYMTDAERREAADDAMDLLLGQLILGGILPPPAGEPTGAAGLVDQAGKDWAAATEADRGLADYITETTPPPPPPDVMAEFGPGLTRVWKILVPVEQELEATDALGAVLDVSTHWAAPSPTVTVTGFTHEAALNAARALRDAGVPMVAAAGEAGVR